MLKKILIGLGIVGFLFAVLASYEIFIAGKRSPKDTVQLSQGNLDVTVVYCRPYKKGRLIFGEKAAGALVPFDQYWRLGANAPTMISFAKNVLFAGKPVAAGTYRMYAVPGAASWKLVLNSSSGMSGAREPDHDKDVLSVDVPVGTAPTPSEQFTIRFADTAMELTWDTTLVRVPLAAS